MRKAFLILMAVLMLGGALWLGGPATANSVEKPSALSVNLASDTMAGTESSTPLVLAYYYVWYGAPEHTDDWEAVYEPLLGRYDSGDPEVIRQHISWAKEAGIDGFLISWWGPGRGEDKNAQKVFQVCPEDFKLAIMVEQVTSEDGSQTWYTRAELDNPAYRKALVNAVDYVVNTFYKPYPEKYLRWRGRPVVVCYAFIDSRAGEAKYTLFFEEVRELIASDTGVEVSFWSLNTRDCLAFDLCAMYNPICQARANPQCPMQDILYRCKSGLKVAGVFPGYDDNRGMVISREGGELYRRQWQRLLDFQPDVVFINTWNEWHEGTSIELAKAWGNLYLRLTSGFVQQLKSRSEEGSRVSRFSLGERGPLFVARDEEETGYCEFCELVPFKGGLFFFNGPQGRIYRLDPISQEVSLLYWHPYERKSDHWRATCWGSCVTQEYKGEKSKLFFAGFAIDARGKYRPYVFRSDDGERFRAIKVADFCGEAYSIFHFVPGDELSQLYVFVADDEHGQTKVFRARSLSGESWELVYTVEEGSYRIGGAIEWFGHLWAVGQVNEPGDPSSKGIIIHYDPGNDRWSHTFYEVGFFSLAKPFMNPEHRVYLGDTDGWIWVTWDMPPSENARLIRLDAPVLRLQWLTNTVQPYSPNLLACTGHRYGWGSLWLLQEGLYPKRLAQNAYGGITGCAPLYNGVAYTTAWDTPGYGYETLAHALGGKGTQTAKVDYVSSHEIALTTTSRDRSRQVVWNKARIEVGSSAVISTLGWDAFEVYFKSDRQGKLKVEFDAGPDPASSDWIELEVIDVPAGKGILTERLRMRGLRARISFDQEARVTAVAYLYP